MRASLVVILAALACATGRVGSGEPARGAVSARFAAASGSYSQVRQRSTASAPCGLATAVRSLTRAEACAGCHDDMIEPVHAQHAHWVDYAAAATSGRALRLAPTPPSAIVLVDGVMVSCTSCHDGASRHPHHTALPLVGSALCVGCHAG